MASTHVNTSPSLYIHGPTGHWLRWPVFPPQRGTVNSRQPVQEFLGLVAETAAENGSIVACVPHSVYFPPSRQTGVKIQSKRSIIFEYLDGH